MEEQVSGVIEELEEIQDDIRFRRSSRYSYVMDVEKYATKILKVVRKDKAFNDVLVGGHVRKKCVFVVGWVRTSAVLRRLKTLIRKQPSSLPVEYKLKIQSGRIDWGA